MGQQDKNEMTVTVPPRDLFEGREQIKQGEEETQHLVKEEKGGITTHKEEEGPPHQLN